jgi:hypothetical protein
MPRFALLLLAALALLFGATAAQAAAPAAAPVSQTAQDADDELLDEEECLLDEDDACVDESWDDVDLACEDELWDGEEWADEEDAEVVDDSETFAEISNDDACADEGAEPAVAPDLTALSATVAGEDAGLRVQVAFRLDQPGAVELTLARSGAAASKRAKTACPSAAKRGRGKAKGKKCGGALPGKLTVTGRAGLNRVDLKGRWRGKKLAPGSYRLTATPKAAGATSDTVAFKIAA